LEFGLPARSRFGEGRGLEFLLHQFLSVIFVPNYSKD